MTYYERLMREKSGKAQLSPAASLYAKKKEDDEEKNKGGLFGGLGYLGHKIGLGFMQGVEGIWDYAAGGIADLFGADEWAEERFKSDWLDYNAADEWYNPGEGWKFAGDVAGGIGTSLPGIATSVGLTLATGGAALPTVAGIGVGSLSAAGTSTKEAMLESGELTGKEYLYGAGMGAVEAVTEKLTGGIGAGVTKAAKSVGKVLGKVAAKEVAESAAKKSVALSLKSAAKSAAKEFAGEAFEEGFAEWVAPYIARATYDPNAKNASAQEIFYSALVGGLAGAGMGGATGALTQGINYHSGKSIVNNGRTQQIMDLAKTYTEEGASDTEAANGIREIYGKLSSAVQSGAGLNREQQRMLGELAAFETQEQLRPMVQRSAIHAIQSADAVAERLNAVGRYKMVDGKLTDTQANNNIPEGAEVREITAEDIRGTYDPKNKKSLAEALKTNDVLRYIAASDAAGRLMLTAQDVERSVLTGTRIHTQAELNEFITSASAEQKAAVGKELDIEDWNTLTVEEFAKKASAYRESGKAEAYKKKAAKVQKMQELADSKARNIPRAIALEDGAVQRYADADSNFAVARDGDTYIVYDYATGNVTRDMTRAEVNAALGRYRNSKNAATSEVTADVNAKNANTSENFSFDAKNEIKDENISKTAFENEFSEEKSRPTAKDIKAAMEAKAQAAAIESLAKEKIKDYADLSKENQSMIRKVLREAMASGLTEAEALSYARVAARSGLDIVFDKKACYKGKNEAGEDVYHAGYYDPENNRIVINPETKRKHASLLIHELSHAMRSYRKNGEVKYFIDEDAKVSEEMWKEIRKYYADENGKVDESLALDEASAYYAEAIFGTEGAIDLLLGEKPTLKQKIISFFAKSAEYYSTDEKLSKEARRHFRKFKVMFDAFAARNYGRNAETGLAGDKKDGRRYSYEGKASDGKSIYKSNFPKGTPKKAKSERILKYITNVWSKEPVSLVISNGETSRTIKAKFDPTIDETQNTPTDASKIAGGNRHGNGTEKRVTLDLADDYYQIVQESKYNYSKEETGKDNPAHEGVKLWHYFVDDIYFIEQENSGLVPYRVTINVKEKDNGDFVYSFNAEKAEESSTQQTLHAAVNTRKGANGELFIDSIPDSAQKSNPSDENSSKKSSDSGKRASMDSDYMSAVERGDMVTAQRMVDEAAKEAGYIPVTRYHQTGKRFTRFSNENPDAALNDSDTPNGYFFKENDHDIGVGADFVKTGRGGNIQMPVYLKHSNLLYFEDREAAQKWYSDNVPKYGELLEKYNKHLDEYRRIDKENTSKMFDELNALVEKGEDTADNELAVVDKYNKIIDDWIADNEAYETSLRAQMRQLLNEYFIENDSGYDGIELADDGHRYIDGKREDVHTYIVFKNTQIKSSDPVTYDDNGNVIPLSERFNPKKSDIRFAMEEIDPAKMGEPTLPRTAGKANISFGQLAKMRAQDRTGKSYSKKDSSDIVERLPSAGMLTEENKALIVENVWQLLNEANANDRMTPGEFQLAVHDIAQYFVASLFKGETVTSLDAIDAKNIVSTLKKGISTLDIPIDIRTEIKNSAEAGIHKRIISRWSFKARKNQTGRNMISAQTFIAEIIKDMPDLNYLKNMSVGQALIEIDAIYEKATITEKEKITPAQFLNLTDEETSKLVADVEKDLLNAYKKGGNIAPFIKQMQKKIDYYKTQADFINQKNYLAKKAQKMRELKIGKYANMTQDHNNMFKRTLGALANIDWQGTIKASMVRKACRTVYEWYTNEDVKKNILFYTKDNAGNVHPGLFNEGIAEMLAKIANNDGNLSVAEYEAMNQIMTYFINFVEKYGKVYFKGQWVDSRTIAERYINQMNKNKRLRVGLFGKIMKTLFFRMFGDPMSLARRMDYYESGFYTEMLEEMREGAINAAVYEMDLLKEYEKFLKENKNYTKKAADEILTYRDTKITKLHLISLYMTLKRKHARTGFVLNGFKFGKGEGAVHVNGLVDPFAEITEEQIDALVEGEMKKIEEMLSDTDKTYISVLETIYNEKAKALKAMRDTQRLGYTNVHDDYYYPIRRIESAKNIDGETVYDEINRLTRASFNKSIVEGDKHALYIEAADTLLLRHCRAVSQYAGLQPAFDAYQMLFNLDISGNPNNPVNVLQTAENLWPQGNAYYMKIIQDLQGIRSGKEDGENLIESIRGGYAKYQLGANPKVWFTQLSSVFASSSILDPTVIAKGFFTVPGEDVDEYCDLARLRNYDNTAARAQGVLDKPLSSRETKGGKIKESARTVKGGLDKFGDLLMAPIGISDRIIIKRLFGCCQAQIEKNGGAKIGTEQNKKEAGKLLEKVILETQQNALQTERSAAMRSSNIIYRSLTMFRSDSMKVLGRVFDSFGEFQVLTEKIKRATEDVDKKEFREKRKEAGVRVLKSCFALLSSAAFMALVAEGFRQLYAKEREEDETVVETMLVDFGGNLLGGLPIFADLYSRFVEGYELDNFAYSAINGLADSVSSVFSAVKNIVTEEGTTQERNRAFRSLVYSTSQFLGIPTRNAFNVVAGLTKRVSKKAGYAIDNAFYEKNYKTDLYKAMEDGNDDMAAYIMGLLLGERLDQSMDDAVFSEILALSKKGYKVLPRTMPGTITVNDEEYELTDEEQNALRAEYSAYTEGLSRLVSHHSYAALTDEEKEYAMDYVSDLYYDTALQSALGVERENKDLILSRALSVDTLALYRTSVRGLASDKDKDGNAVAGSKRKKVIAAINALGVRREERLLLIASAGYSLKDGDIRGLNAEAANNLLLRYILSMKISKDEKAALAQACGFTVKNGKILKKSV